MDKRPDASTYEFMGDILGRLTKILLHIMKNCLYYSVLSLALFAPTSVHAQDTINGLTIKTQIDSTYVFGFNLTESRSAKGGIWNVKTGKAETPLSYTKIKKDTIDGQPVIMLYREVALGNHPLNRWETWVQKEGKWVNAEEAENEPQKQQQDE